MEYTLMYGLLIKFLILLALKWDTTYNMNHDTCVFMILSQESDFLKLFLWTIE